MKNHRSGLDDRMAGIGYLRQTGRKSEVLGRLTTAPAGDTPTGNPPDGDRTYEAARYADERLIWDKESSCLNSNLVLKCFVLKVLS